MTIVVAAVAGSVGALARYFVSGIAQERSRSSMPVGTGTVNLVGAFALGCIVGVGSASSIWSVAATGLIGGFTTFSTWMVESVRLGLIPRPSSRAILNLTATGLLGVACAALGYYLTN